jgi:hypothetical protein
MFDLDDSSFLDNDEFDSADDIFSETPKTKKAIPFSWAWIAKYRVPFRPSPEGFDGIYYYNITHTGIYSPTGAGKTFLRNTIVEVSLWAHDTNIVISDRKMDSLGFLLPQHPSIMMNAQFFPNPRNGQFPIIPDCLPRDRFHLWLPATHYSYIDPLVRELMEWDVVKFYRFHPRIFIETTMGDHIPHTVGMTQIESLATTKAIMQTKGRIRSESERENWTLDDLREEIESQPQLTHMSKPYQKLMILEDSGIISKESTVELIDKTTGDHLQEKVHVFKNFNDIITRPANQPVYDKTSHLHVFCNKYMSSSTADNTLSTCVNYILFSAIKEACEAIHKKRRVLCHLPEAEYSLSKHSSENQNDKIRNYFAGSYGDALRETRQWQLYHFLDTQQVTELPSKITANQMTLWLLPGFKHKAELNWLQAGLGRAHLDPYKMRDLFSMRNPFENRGKAFYIGEDIAEKCWTRPRQTYHFTEGDDPVELLKDYRLTFGLDNVKPWIRWDEE